jgi:hypothetical protein
MQIKGSKYIIFDTHHAVPQRLDILDLYTFKSWIPLIS